MIFRKWGGGSKAVWNFSKNSSLSEMPSFPYGDYARDRSKKSEIREIRDYAKYGGNFFGEEIWNTWLRQLRWQIFPEKSKTRNYGGSEKFFGQIAQLRKYVITNLQKNPNHPLVLPLVSIDIFKMTITISIFFKSVDISTIDIPPPRFCTGCF